MKRRVHYAWVILGLAFATIALGSGVRLAFGSFVHPWEQDFGVSRGAISVVATLSFVCYGLLQPIVGRWADRKGPGGVLAASLLAVAAGLVLTSQAASIWQVGFTFGLVASLGFAGVSQVPAAVAVTRWFHDRRGLAMALLTLASSFGQMTLVPASLFLNDSLGWRHTVLVYAAGLVVLAPVIFWLLKPDPASVGLTPYGSGGFAAPPQATPTSAARSGWAGLARLLATPDFWWLALPYLVCGFTTTGLIDTHLVPFAEDHHLPTGATATAVTVLAACNSAGVLLSGYLSDRIPRRYLLAFLYGMRAVTLLFLITVESPVALLAFSVVFGLVDFSTVPPTTSLTAELFGEQNLGMVLGLISLSHQAGSALGGVVPGLLYDLAGSYQGAFLTGAVMLVAASVLSLWVRESGRLKEKLPAAG